jgi:hypothetical protein
MPSATRRADCRSFIVRIEGIPLRAEGAEFVDGVNLSCEPDDEAGSAPKLYVVPVDKTCGFLDRLDIVSAYQRLETYNVTVNTNGVRSVLCHSPPSTHRMSARYRAGVGPQIRP